MKSTLILFLFFVLSESIFATEPPQYSLRYDPKRDAMQDGYAAIKLSKETNRRILIEVGGDWCKWCHLLDRFLNKHSDIKTQLHKTFVLLKVNVSEENDNHAFLKVFPPPLGYPHMYVMESNGKLLLSKDTGEFLVNGKYSKQRFKEFFEQFKLNNKINKKHTHD